MSTSQALNSPFDHHQTTTTVYPAERSTSEKQRAVAFVGGTSVRYSDEIQAMLRSRLRIAGTIALAGFLVFFIRGFFLLGEYRPEVTLQIVHGGVVALLTIFTTILWTRLPISHFGLRTFEVLMFGTMALFFAYLQFLVFHDGRVLEWAEPAYRDQILTLATAGNALRWFVLIVLYGTFIPNTWRRCAVVVGIMALTPLALTMCVCHSCPIMGPHTGPAVFDFAVALSMAAAIAIFGSYRISELHQEVVQARKLGQYQLHRRLGSGGMGEVYLGEHLLLKRSCAVKLIRPEQVDETNLSRFEREVRAMATLTHWNTVEVYDYGHAEDGTFYYVMEYLPGMSLQELVEQHGPLPAARAVHFLRQVCAALREAHSIGLIHRDVKPSNVIASERGGIRDIAKLLDFGLVQKYGLADDNTKLTSQGTILGSPPYISPEQALGKTTVDARTDIYSVGGLAYFLLTGQPPFVRETATEMLVAHVHEMPIPPNEVQPEVPDDLADIVMRCLQKKREDRYQDIETLDRALADCDCADHWTRQQAAVWWEEHKDAVIEEGDFVVTA